MSFAFYPKWALRGGEYTHAAYWKLGIDNKIMMSFIYVQERLNKIRKYNFSIRKMLDIGERHVIFIDSGGYTFLGKNSTPSILEYAGIIKKLDIDIYASVDLPVTPLTSIEQRLRNQKTTLKHNKYFLNHKLPGKLLYGVVFGWSKDSIQKMTELTLALEKCESFDGFAIGSLIPFSKSYMKLVEIMSTVRKSISDRPLHAFGIGHIEGMYLSAALGINSVDSTRYIIAGEFREYLLPQTGTPVYIGRFYKKMNRRKIRDLPCYCPICQQNHLSELAKTGSENSAKVALHNLCIQIGEAKLIKSALEEGWFEKLLKQKAAMYPRLGKVMPHLLRLKLYER